MEDEKKIEGVIRKIEALLNVKGCTEAEAEARIAKAQELLEAYNLDMAEIGKTGKGQQRKDQKLSGGLYSWQRNLWQAVAELNFCYYVSIKGLARGSTYEHRLIGSHANVIASTVMAKYLQETIEKTAQQWAKDNFYKSVFVREAIAYREGMSSRIAARLNERRQEQMAVQRAKDEERKREEARNAVAPGTTALTILDVISTERDLNNDYLNNWEPGTTARNRADWERKIKEQKAAHEAWWNSLTEEDRKKVLAECAKLQAEFDREWKKQQRRAEKRVYKPRYRKPTPEEERQGLGSYWEGHSAGAKVNLDQQVDEDKRRKLA